MFKAIMTWIRIIHEQLINIYKIISYKLIRWLLSVFFFFKSFTVISLDIMIHILNIHRTEIKPHHYLVINSDRIRTFLNPFQSTISRTFKLEFLFNQRFIIWFTKVNHQLFNMILRTYHWTYLHIILFVFFLLIWPRYIVS